MSYNNINPIVPLEAIRDTLIADATLAGASYLTSTGRIFTRRAPNSQTCPYLVIESKEIFSNGIFQFSGEIRVFCYTAILLNGQISPLGDLILMRCQELLNDQQIIITGMSTISATTSIVPSFFDPEADESKARGVLRVKLDFGQS
jgi:hypothetical protein